jgi:dimethylhistidine N-methyltransferase
MPQQNRDIYASATDQHFEFAESVIDGLSKPRKSLPCRYFYDARGSELFEEITLLPEYYLTRAETAILNSHAAEIASPVPDGTVLVEFGSGFSRKTEILLAALPRLNAYVPIDASESALEEAKRRLLERFPEIDVRPVAADFSRPADLPPEIAEVGKLGFFPGSTIGNFPPLAARRLLRLMRRTLLPEARLIVGVDLKKDVRQLISAYNDAAGVTAAFNLNLLVRINRELEGTFDLDAFRHEAIYNPREGRIEMHLVSVKDQAVTIRGRLFRFFASETIHTENSYKYSIGQFQELAQAAGWLPRRRWTDSDGLFSVHELTCNSDKG